MKTFHIVISLVLASVVTARSCDLCGCYTPDLDAIPGMEMTGMPPWLAGWYAGVTEQFTHFGTDRFDGRETGNPTGQYLNSSITQVILGQTLPIFDHRFGVQLSLPFIDRDFKRPNGFTIDRGNDFGLGDASLVANFILFKKQASFFDLNSSVSAGGKNPVPVFHEPDFSAIVNLTAGIKLPTGDTSRLKENFHEVDVPGAPESGIGGHDLTLGTGSVDGIFGIQGLVRYKQWFVQADAQYSVRSEGDYDYRFANDLSWSGGPGFYFIRHKGTTLGLQAIIAGDTKGYDEFQGAPDTDTGATALYLGPRILGSTGRWNGEVGVDIPVLMNTTQFQTAPSWRVRAGFSFRF